MMPPVLQLERSRQHRPWHPQPLNQRRGHPRKGTLSMRTDSLSSSRDDKVIRTASESTRSGRSIESENSLHTRMKIGLACTEP
jgi:hypothetical protein